MKIKYTAWLQSILEKHEEVIDLHKSIKTIDDLIVYLSNQNVHYQEAFKNKKVIFVAKNLQSCGFSERITDADEITFFAPIAGG